MYCFGEMIMLRTEQFPILWMNCLLQSSFSSCRHCIWVCLVKFIDGGREGWLLNNRNSITMHCAKLCPSFVHAITRCCVFGMISAAADVPAFYRGLYRSSAGVDFDCAVISSLPVVHSSLKPFLWAVLRWFCSVVCSWGSAHAFVSCVSHGKVCLCRVGCSSGLCLLEERCISTDGCNTSGTLGDEPFGGDN